MEQEAPVEKPLNKKDITALVAGKCIDFDDDYEAKTAELENETENPKEQYELPEGELHPLVGVMDMMITTAQGPLRKHGYPEPNLSIWEEWGKPNLSKAFVQYMPMNSAAGQAVNSPAFAGIIGLGALVIAFLPVILHFIEKKKAEKEAEEEAQRQAAKVPQKQPQQQQVQQVPQPVENKPVERPVEVRRTVENPQKRIETADRAAPPQIVKLPGGGDDATPSIPMAELIARNMASGGEMPI